MSVQSDPVPPVPEHTPPLKEDDGTPKFGKYFNHAWTRWFISLREKINVLNASIISLSEITGVGFLSKVGVSWVLRTITGTSSRVQVVNGDGSSGDPTIDVITANLVPGTGITFTGSGTNRIIGTANLIINATGGSGSSGILPLVTGEVLGGQPVFIFLPDGNLIYVQVA